MSLILKVSILVLIASGIQAGDTDDNEPDEPPINPIGAVENYLEQYYVDHINYNVAHFTVIFHISYIFFSIQLFANIPMLL